MLQAGTARRDRCGLDHLPGSVLRASSCILRPVEVLPVGAVGDTSIGHRGDVLQDASRAMRPLPPQSARTVAGVSVASIGRLDRAAPSTNLVRLPATELARPDRPPPDVVSGMTVLSEGVRVIVPCPVPAGRSLPPRPVRGRSGGVPTTGTQGAQQCDGHGRDLVVRRSSAADDA